MGLEPRYKTDDIDTQILGNSDIIGATFVLDISDCIMHQVM